MLRTRVVLCCVVTALLLAACSPRNKTAETAPRAVPAVAGLPETREPYRPDSSATCVELTTPFGTMKVELYCNTGLHKENFLKLVREGFLEGLLFHRVVSGFMIQGGDPNSRNAGPQARLGAGGPGYTLPAEFDDHYVHVKGALCAARLGDEANPEKESSGSQFYLVQGRPVTAEQLDHYERTKGIAYSARQRQEYLTLGGTPQLDREYTVFGRVYEGLEVIDKIAEQAVNAESRPLKNVTMSWKVIGH
jgi:cyclophilin family peptidyl-prolyl cis-trans isomerase